MANSFRELMAVAVVAQGLVAQTPTGTVSGTVHDDLVTQCYPAARQQMDYIARVIVIWLKRGRG